MGLSKTSLCVITDVARVAAVTQVESLANKRGLFGRRHGQQTNKKKKKKIASKITQLVNQASE